MKKKIIKKSKKLYVNTKKGRKTNLAGRGKFLGQSNLTSRAPSEFIGDVS